MNIGIKCIKCTNRYYNENISLNKNISQNTTKYEIMK